MIRKDILAKALCGVMVFSLVAGFVPEKAMAAQGIPAYEYKDVFETGTVSVEGIKVEEVVDGVTQPINKSITFTLYNSTKQEVQETVTSKNGVLPAIDFVKNHNYIFFAEDSEYEMKNAYVWMKDGKLVDMKNGIDAANNSYNYQELTSLQLTKISEDGPTADFGRRATLNLEVYGTTGEAGVYNVQFKLISEVETIEVTNKGATSGRTTIQESILEDVDYILVAESNDYDIDPFPVTIKDKSEYNHSDGSHGGRYSYDHSDCHAADKVTLIKKQDAHKNDTTITSDTGNTTVAGFNFKDLILRDEVLDKSQVTTLSGDYDVINIKAVNTHRYEIAKLAVGEFRITEKVDPTKQVKNVYYIDKDNNLQSVDFVQEGNEVNFTMNSLSIYPVVIAYEDTPIAFDNTKIYVKAVDESGKPVSNLQLSLSSESSSMNFAATTDVDGKASYTCSGSESVSGAYTLIPSADSGYTCESPATITFDQSNGSKYIKSIDGANYTNKTGRITIVVKKSEGPVDPQPEFNSKVLNVKVVDEYGNPVPNLMLYLSGDYEDYEFDSVTDANGKAKFTCDDAAWDGEYELLSVEDSGYACESPIMVTLELDDDFNAYIAYLDDDEYTSETGEITVIVTPN